MDYLYKNNSNDFKEPLSFKDEIEFRNISYSYPQTTKKIFKNLNMKIKKNKFYGLQGITGAGKSTFVDLFSGLLKDYDGEILVDNKLLSDENNKLWQKNISYVPQMLFLYDDSLLNNLTNFHDHDFDEKKRGKEVQNLKKTKGTYGKYLTCKADTDDIQQDILDTG